VVHEKVRTILLRDEPESLRVVEPFDGSISHDWPPVWALRPEIGEEALRLKGGNLEPGGETQPVFTGRRSSDRT
jgi:hypothetical protein